MRVNEYIEVKLTMKIVQTYKEGRFYDYFVAKDLLLAGIIKDVSNFNLDCGSMDCPTGPVPVSDDPHLRETSPSV